MAGQTGPGSSCLATQKPGSWFKYAKGTLRKWDVRHNCVVCEHPAYQPMVHDCGSWLCEACCNSGKNCPTCEEELEGRLKPVTAKPIIAKLSAIEVHCTVCNEIILRESLLSHISQCPVDCPKECGVKVAPVDQAQHEKTECLSVLVACELCHEFVPRRAMKDLSHKKLDCPVDCPNLCGMKVQPKNQAAHEQTDCLSVPVICTRCNASVARKLIKDMSHTQLDCPIDCPEGCGEKVKPRHLTEHKSSTCPKVIVQCCAQFCTWSGQRGGLTEHIQSCVLVKMSPALTFLVSENKAMKEMLSLQANMLQEMEASCHTRMLELTSRMQELEKVLLDADHLQKQIDMLRPTRVRFTSLNGEYDIAPTDDYAPLPGNVTLSRGIQRWVALVTGKYRVTAVGASGGGSDGGLGAIVTTICEIREGQPLNILVGQVGRSGSPAAGGGGGTFVWEDGVTLSGSPITTNGKILICAGGGGGGATLGPKYLGKSASLSPDGNSVLDSCSRGGTNGGGGGGGRCATTAIIVSGGGGAGWSSNGSRCVTRAADRLPPYPCTSPLNGGKGGVACDCGGNGGFGGGGGSAEGYYGGGGGFSGGAPGSSDGHSGTTAGGGGGSFAYNSGGPGWSVRLASRRDNGSVTIALLPSDD
ncbi:hypothetical protein Pelo_11004 [Pelomyxa schiedti]|nr:hypothetical protein Pelo_11004 [Pelomyxa schiedti]